MRIGIILTGDYSWAGGVYYSLNIIKLLHSLSLSKKIKIVVIVNSDTPADLIKEIPTQNTELSYLDKKNFFYKVYHKLKGDRFIADINRLNLDILYPLISYDPSHAKLNCKPMYWLYDFQHKFLPELFSSEEIKQRDLVFENIASHGKDIVFSSHNSKSHFEKFFPNSKANKYVYNFVSLIENHNKEITISAAIPKTYFIVCNQFWPHKNHLTVLKALNHLLQQNKHVHIVFTGKYNDERSKTYVDSLKNYIKENQLENNITLTGLISREEQVELIKKAWAVIQPSFFEGWSTVVEDAKALGKFMILSDIGVNREQVKEYVKFFKPEDYLQLAKHIQELYLKELLPGTANYNENIKTAKDDLVKLFKISE